MIQAEDVNYWKTGERSAEASVDRAEKYITDAGGVIEARGIGHFGGAESILLGFKLEGQAYRIVWPVLESRTGNAGAARRQAGSFVLYDVKAKCLAAQVLGWRTAMLPYLVTPNGLTAAEITTPELVDALPKLLT